MGNDVYEAVLKELDFLGEIFSHAILKEALRRQNTKPDEVTVFEMRKALDNHIAPSTLKFVTRERVEIMKRGILHKLDALDK